MRNVIYIQNNLIAKHFNDPVFMDLEVVCVEINTGNNRFLIVSSWNNINSLIDRCSNTFSNIIIVCDFNEDLLKIHCIHPIRKQKQCHKKAKLKSNPE